MYYVSPKYEPQIQKKLAIKRISTAISNLKKSKLMRSDEDGKLQSLQTRRYENAKAYLNDLTKNHIDDSNIPDGLKGLGITMILTGLLSMAYLSFSGINL